MKNVTKENKIIKIIRWLFFVYSLILIVFGGMYLFRGMWMLTLMFIINAVVFLWLNRVIEQKKKWIFWFAIVFIGINIVLIVVNQFSFIDFPLLVLGSILFVMILGNKKKLALR